MPNDVLRGDAVVLRRYREDDAAEVQRLADDPLVLRWVTQRFASPYTLEHARRWIQEAISGSGDQFAIELNGRYAGGIGIVPSSGERAGSALFGYWLGRPFWGRGIMTDAARTLAEYALGVLRLRRLEASVFAPNVASARVLEKIGFAREGVLRFACVERDGTPVDEYIYGRVSSLLR